MTPTHAAAKAVTVPCETPSCTAYLTVPPDTYVPKFWFCPACEDHIYDQQMDALAKQINHEGQEPSHADIRQR